MITQLTERAIAIKVPEGSEMYTIHENKLLLLFSGGQSARKKWCDLPPGQWQILGIASELTEEDWKKVVELVGGWSNVIYYDYNTTARDYRDIVEAAFKTATQSGQSLLASKNLPMESTLILIKQNEKSRQAEDIRQIWGTVRLLRV